MLPNPLPSRYLVGMTPFDLLAIPKTDPLSIYRYRDGIYAGDLLAAALVHLDLFTWLTDRDASSEEICSHFQLHARPTDVMLTLFNALGYLQCVENRWSSTLMAQEHLTADSPWNLTPYYGSLKDRPVTLDLLRVLRTGKPANWGSYKMEEDWHKAMEKPEFAKSFTAAMDCRGVYLGGALARQLAPDGFHRLLDVGGGSGVYACSLVAHHPHLKATVLDKSPVDQIAAQAISARGFDDRVGVMACDMFAQEWPEGYDLHLLSNVLHDWDEPEVAELLRRSFAALPAGGMIIIHDAFINADKSGPLAVAAYSVILMHSTEGKCYSITEYERFLIQSGFEGISFSQTVADRGVMTARKPSKKGGILA